VSSYFRTRQGTKAELDDKNSLVPLSFFSQTFACPENVKIKLLTLGGDYSLFPKSYIIPSGKINV
jgi:hypothetical protein